MPPDDSAPEPMEGAAGLPVNDILEMVALVELNDVYLWEERGRRIDETKLDGDEVPRIRNIMNIADRADGAGIGYRFRMSVDDRVGNEFIADFQAQYELAEIVQIPVEIRQEFAERVAFFTVYPYLRASIQMMASRMGAPAPVLQIVRAGEFTLGTQMTFEDAEAQFSDRVPEG